MASSTVARSPVAVFEARRALVDDELSALADEHGNIERLIAQLQRRREILDGRWELLIAERDLLDERIWQRVGQPVEQPRAPCSLVPQPPVLPQGRATGPRDLAPEPWDFAGLELAS